MPAKLTHGQLDKLVKEFTEVLDRKDEKAGELDQRKAGVNRSAANDAANVWAFCVDEKGYLNSPNLIEPGKFGSSGIRLGKLIGMGGQNYVFDAEVDFDKLYLAPFYKNIRRHEIRNAKGGRFDSLRSHYDTEAKEEAEWLYSAGRIDTMRALVEPILKSKFDSGKCVVRVRMDLVDKTKREVIDSMNRAKALDGMVHRNLIFSALSGETFPYNDEDGQTITGKAFNLVEYVDDLIDPDEIYKVLTPYEIVEITRQAATALGALDELGVSHRDIKPDNLFVTKGRRDVNVRISDYDLLRITEREQGASSSQTQGWFFKGSTKYSSVEHWTHPEIVDIRSDFVSLGLTATKWRTGEEPRHFPAYWFMGINTPQKEAELHYRISKEVTEEKTRPIGIWGMSSGVRYDGLLRWYHYLGFGKVKDELDRLNRNFYNVLAGMIVTDREKRYQHPKEVADDLARVLKGESVTPRADPYKIFCSSRRDIRNPKSFGEKKIF